MPYPLFLFAFSPFRAFAINPFRKNELPPRSNHAQFVLHKPRICVQKRTAEFGVSGLPVPKGSVPFLIEESRMKPSASRL